MKRILEMIPATVSWSILILPIVFSTSHPIAVAYFLIIFVFLWFFRTIEYIVFLVVSFAQFKQVAKKNFSDKLRFWQTGDEKYLNKVEKKLFTPPFTNKNQLQNLKKRRQKCIEDNDYISVDDLHHIVIIATCGEDELVLADTIDSVLFSDYDTQKIIVVLATEKRMEPESTHIAENLKSRYQSKFGAFYHFAHPENLPGEVKGKGGNITHSGREITKILESEQKNLDHYIVTTLDADNRMDKNYLPSLSLSYLTTVDRQKKSYQPLPLFYNNIWEVPSINRMIAISGGFWHMIESARSYRLHNFSSHAQPLKALKEMDFWATDTIVEDGHQFWRSYFHFKGNYSVVPLFTPIYQDAVMNHSYPKTIVAQYKQIRRWAWGASDIPFVLMNWMKNFSSLPKIETFIHFIRLFESHIFWATAAIVITLATPIPELINPEFEEIGYAIRFSETLAFFFNGAIIGMILIILLSIITLPKPPKKIYYVKNTLQWLFIPVMTIFFGAIPALDAQTRLFLGKYLGFNVTEKIRKTETKNDKKGND